MRNLNVLIITLAFSGIIFLTGSLLEIMAKRDSIRQRFYGKYGAKDTSVSETLRSSLLPTLPDTLQKKSQENTPKAFTPDVCQNIQLCLAALELGLDGSPSTQEMCIQKITLWCGGDPLSRRSFMTKCLRKLSQSCWKK